MKQSNSRNSAFQLTASQGGWPHLAGWPLSVPYFNSQPHKEADGWNITRMRMLIIFQLTASQGGWLCSRTGIELMMYFNSQPHKEADDGELHTTIAGVNISTHSLTRRLTVTYWNGLNRHFNISTHSLTRRLTTLLPTQERTKTYFNSQPHKEADHYPLDLRQQRYNFNSQPHKEADRLPTYLFCLVRNFNSQPHKEADEKMA